MITIVRARLKPMGGVAEFISVQGRIKALIENNREENFDFVIDENGAKKVKSFGIDNINDELVGKEVPIINNTFKAKFNNDGTVDIVSGTSESRIMKFSDFEKVLEGSIRQRSVDQLKKLRAISKKTDISDRIKDQYKNVANLSFIHNPVDTGVESWEDDQANNKKFIPSWNVNHKIGPFDGRSSD